MTQTTKTDNARFWMIVSHASDGEGRRYATLTHGTERPEWDPVRNSRPLDVRPVTPSRARAIMDAEYDTCRQRTGRGYAWTISSSAEARA